MVMKIGLIQLLALVGLLGSAFGANPNSFNNQSMVKDVKNYKIELFGGRSIIVYLPKGGNLISYNPHLDETK